MSNLFITPTQFNDWLIYLSKSGGKLKAPITFKFKSREDFVKSYIFLGSSVGLPKIEFDNIMKHQFAKADMCEHLQVPYYFRIDLQPISSGGQVQITPVLVPQLLQAFPSSEYARKMILISLAPDVPNESDLELVKMCQQIIENQ